MPDVAAVAGVAAADVAALSLVAAASIAAVQGLDWPSGGGGGYVTDGLVMYIDAGDASSYPGTGEIWANLVAAPADGSAQSDYDYALGQSSGNTTDNPTFVGTAGSPTSYFNFFSGGYMTLEGAATAFFKSMHKSGSKFTIEMWIRLNGSGGQGGGIHPMWDSGTSDQGGSDMSRGVIFADQGTLGSGAGGRNGLRVKRDSSAQNALAVWADDVIPDSQIVQLAVSFDGTGADPSFLWINGGFDQVGSSNTFDGTLDAPGVSDTTNASRIAARGDGASQFEGRIYLMRIYNDRLSDTELLQNWDNDRGRFGL